MKHMSLKVAAACGLSIAALVAGLSTTGASASEPSTVIPMPKSEPVERYTAIIGSDGKALVGSSGEILYLDQLAMPDLDATTVLQLQTLGVIGETGSKASTTRDGEEVSAPAIVLWKLVEGAKSQSEVNAVISELKS